MNFDGELNLNDLTEYMYTRQIMLSVVGDRLNISTPPDRPLTDEMLVAFKRYEAEVIEWLERKLMGSCEECRHYSQGSRYGSVICDCGMIRHTFERPWTPRWCTVSTPVYL